MCFFALWFPYESVFASEEGFADLDFVYDVDEYEIEEVYDPYEKFNRAMYKFNTGLDQILLEPVSKIYQGVVPEYGRGRISSFLENLSVPLTVINNILQGKFERAAYNSWRFLINTSLGVGGINDIATSAGLPEYSRMGFGETVNYYSGGRSAYLVLPILGPSSVKDFGGSVVDYFIDPYNIVFKGYKFERRGAETVNLRAIYTDYFDNLESTTLDPYASVRSTYMQLKRSKLLNNN